MAEEWWGDDPEDAAHERNYNVALRGQVIRAYEEFYLNSAGGRMRVYRGEKLHHFKARERELAKRVALLQWIGLLVALFLLWRLRRMGGI